MDSSDPAPTPLPGLRGRRLIPPFALARPTDVADALRLGAEPGTRWMAGGVELVDRMKHGMAVDRLVPLGGLEALRSVARIAGGVRIGALVTYQDAADDPLVRAAAPDLAALLGEVANVRIRCKATLGGSVMSFGGAYDALPALMALGAALVFDGGAGEERLAADAVRPGEHRLLVGIEVPYAADARLVADRSLRPALCIYVGVRYAGGAVTAVRAAAGCAHPVPVAASLPLDRPDPAELPARAAAIGEALAAALPDPVSDGLASAAYRRRMAGVLIARALAEPLHPIPETRA